MSDVDRVVGRLLARRVHIGLSQYRLAALAGLSRTSLCEWEGGLHQPSFDNVCRWAEVLGFEVVLRPKRDDAEGADDAT